jgi:hypothetical protein
MKNIARLSIHAAFALILVFAGWAIGTAQSSQPTFELLVDAPGGETVIECVRGCRLSWVERGVLANATAASKFTYSCSGSRCSSGRVGGWLVP